MKPDPQWIPATLAHNVVGPARMSFDILEHFSQIAPIDLLNFLRAEGFAPETTNGQGRAVAVPWPYR